MTRASCPRFIVLSNFDSAAVLDRETGIVWERTPLRPDDRLIPPETGMRNWFEAHVHCFNRNVGGRKGWRLPSVQELSSLIDPLNEDSNARSLPPGHPFFGIEDFYYWSATTKAAPSTVAWAVSFADRVPVHFGDKAAELFVWCVRGGQGLEAQ
jgi:hypothetical protein